MQVFNVLLIVEPLLLTIVFIAVLLFVVVRYVLPQMKSNQVTLTATLQNVVDMSFAMHSQITRLIKSESDQSQRLAYMELEQAKKDIFSSELPYPEKVWAAHKYTRLGGNGDVASYIKNKLRPQHVREFDSLWFIADGVHGKVDLDSFEHSYEKG